MRHKNKNGAFERLRFLKSQLLFQCVLQNRGEVDIVRFRFPVQPLRYCAIFSYRTIIFAFAELCKVYIHKRNNIVCAAFPGC